MSDEENFDFSTDLPDTAGPDDDLVPDKKSGGPMSDLDMLRADTSVDPEIEEITLAVKKRPGYAVRYRPEFNHDQLEFWRRRSRNQKTRVVNIQRLSELILANTCVAILKDGRVLTNNNGDSLTFSSPEILELYGVKRAGEAATRFYASDAYVQADSDRIIDAAGWGETSEDADDDEFGPDPTQSA